MATQKIARKNWFETVVDSVIKNNQKITLVIAFVLVASVLFVGHRWWMNYQNRSAQGYFGMLVMEYGEALHDKNPDWDALRVKFEKGFADHSRSSLIPYYKSYVVNMLLQQNKV